MTPTEFVLARTADRERMARGLQDSYDGLVASLSSPPLTQMLLAPHLAANDPAAVLARCAVDRRILEEHETIRARYAGSTIEDDPCCKTCSGYGDDPGEYPCATVALLASLDADHPDYDKSWWPL